MDGLSTPPDEGFMVISRSLIKSATAVGKTCFTPDFYTVGLGFKTWISIRHLRLTPPIAHTSIAIII